MIQQQSNLVEVRGVSFSRGDRTIFDDISLTVPKGKVTAIMGPSGIGKTTLLRLIGGQLQPTSGEIFFRGENIPSLSRTKLYEARKKMSMLFQSGALFTDLTVYENVAWPLREHTRLPPPLQNLRQRSRHFYNHPEQSIPRTKSSNHAFGRR
jgi:phospholipid/cholesterol/gamma-HCH transport system ATP-binding protein